MSYRERQRLSDIQAAIDAIRSQAATRYATGEERVTRGIVVHQAYWKAYGTWRPEAWRVSFVVSAAGQILGAQELEGNDFPALRTIDTASFLRPWARGRGYGKQMRRAVLSLAFGPMGAQAAITSAWHDNHASLGVSRALGYQPNGESLDARGDSADVMVHMRLLSAQWLASGAAADIHITGFEGCRHLFGLSLRLHALDDALSCRLAAVVDPASNR
jgi:RimJ/RimL family protein N-acetyltransferase